MKVRCDIGALDGERRLSCCGVKIDDMSGHRNKDLCIMLEKCHDHSYPIDEKRHDGAPSCFGSNTEEDRARHGVVTQKSGAMS